MPKAGANHEWIGTSCVFMGMKRLILAVAVLGSVVGTSLTALADEDHRDHNWDDDYWHHEHYGYWHGDRGYWTYHHHKHVWIHVGPVTVSH
jgi:hypothetical protein